MERLSRPGVPEEEVGPPGRRPVVLGVGDDLVLEPDGRPAADVRVGGVPAQQLGGARGGEGGLAEARTPARPGVTAGPPRPAPPTGAGGQGVAVVGGVAVGELGVLGPLDVEVQVVLPGEADPAVDLEARGHHPLGGVRAPDLGGGRRPAPTPARRSTAAHAAYQVAERIPSTSTSMSAQRCLTAWKLPIGTPNWTRSLAYCGGQLEHPVAAAEQLGRGGQRAEGPEVGDASAARRCGRTAWRRGRPTTRVRVRSMAGCAGGRPTDGQVDQVDAVGHHDHHHVGDRGPLHRSEPTRTAPAPRSPSPVAHQRRRRAPTRPRPRGRSPTAGGRRQVVEVGAARPGRRGPAAAGRTAPGPRGGRPPRAARRPPPSPSPRPPSSSGTAMAHQPWSAMALHSVCGRSGPPTPGGRAPRPRPDRSSSSCRAASCSPRWSAERSKSMAG